jgi:predicted nucleotidyltransferase component of viral defense system
MIPRAALRARASEWGLTEEIVEKDYVLGWLLWGIGSDPTLREHWIFKGGTCLKKCFVETYRFSEDLDFTVRDGGPLEPDDLLPILRNLLDTVEQETGITLMSREPRVKMRPDGRSAEGRIYYIGSTSLTTRRLSSRRYAAGSPTPTTRTCPAMAPFSATRSSRSSPRSSEPSANEHGLETCTTW